MSTPARYLASPQGWSGSSQPRPILVRGHDPFSDGWSPAGLDRRLGRFSTPQPGLGARLPQHIGGAVGGSVTALLRCFSDYRRILPGWRERRYSRKDEAVSWEAGAGSGVPGGASSSAGLGGFGRADPLEIASAYRSLLRPGRCGRRPGTPRARPGQRVRLFQGDAELAGQVQGLLVA